ncbi:hypothetical protein [Pseudomonas putida]|uniref:hypothetical protein n=1 Tax=Pseudomonas putida TaxID=303 RepID=UPI0007B80051|nr:hypothetical protein [Pseudomonas putida]
MSELTPFISRRALIEKNIRQELATHGASQPLNLPTVDSPLVTHYVNRIEGSYDSSRAKIDTDHAIDLLYIAYNTTPQRNGDIRVKISSIMNNLIKAQQESERQIKAASNAASRLTRKLNRGLTGWTAAKETGDIAQIKRFVNKELMEMANEIKNSAMAVNASLQTIVDRYDCIIDDTHEVTASSEMALSTTLEANEKIRQEILQHKARSKQLESLIADMQQQVKRYESLARDYANQAKSSEERAFWAGILRGAAQVISAAMPLAAMAASGGSSSLVAAASVAAGVGKGANGAQGNATGDLIRLKKERSEHRAELALIKEEVDKLQTSISGYQAQKGKEADTGKLKVLENRITEAEGLLAKAKAKHQEAKEHLGSLESALQALASAAGDISDASRAQANNLRQMQLQMLDNADKYETARREQAAELLEVSVLMAGKGSEQEIIELAIRSLNLSVSALKRTREIVVEIAFFFRSFCDFMEVIRQDAQEQIEEFEDAEDIDSSRDYLFSQLCESTDAFFISQTGQWIAVGIVSDHFALTFKDGWSKLNKLSGKYITNDELPAYLTEAAGKLDMIAADRNAASHERQVYLENYRNELNAD